MFFFFLENNETSHLNFTMLYFELIDLVNARFVTFGIAIFFLSYLNFALVDASITRLIDAYGNDHHFVNIVKKNTHKIHVWTGKKIIYI